MWNAENGALGEDERSAMSYVTGSDVKSYMMSASELETSITGSDVKQMIEVSATKLEIPASFKILYQNDIWICDTGASSHSTPYRLGARNKRASGSASLGHAGEAVKATSTIDLPGQFVAKDGGLGMKGTLADCNFNESLNFNLLILTRLLCSGWSITKGNATGITIQNGSGSKIEFDIVIPTARGALFACRFIREAEFAGISTEAGSKMNIQKAHNLLGHGNEEATRKSAQQLGWVLTRGKLKPCEHCAKAKSKHKNVCKESTAPKATEPGGRVCLDLSKVTVSRDDGSDFQLNQKNWKSIVDEHTGKKWCDFTKTKNGMVEPTCEFLHKLKSRGIPVKIIRLDPGGENLKLEKRAASVDWKELQPLDFEFTSRDTPQHNSLAETSFPYIAGKARAMMGAAHVPTDIRGKVAIEAIKCATQLDGLVVVKLGDKTGTRDEHVFGANPKWAKNLRTWGEAGVVREGKDGKTGDRGQSMMFVGYANNRESDSVKMWNPETNRVVTTLIWLKRMFYEQSATDETLDLEPDALEPTADDAIDDEALADDDDDEIPPLSENEEEDEESVADDEDEESAAEETIPFAAKTRSGRITRPKVRLIETMTNFADLAGTAAELRYLGSLAELDNDEVATIELSLVGAGIGGGYTNSAELKVMNYKEAMASKDAEAWTEEVGNEKKRFDKFKAFTAVQKSKVPKGAKILTTTWACKKKPSGKLRGRLNIRGYEQVDGKHYYSDSIAAPVTNPNTVRIVLVLLAMNPKWISMLIDVEGAFLQGKFENGEELYAYVPDGFEKFYDEENEVLKLNVPIYGTKQAAHCFYKALVKKAKEKEYERSKADPCLFYCWVDGRLVVFVSWVDDIMACGEPDDVKQLVKDLEDSFECKCEGELKEYVGSKIDIVRKSDGLATVKFTQPVLIQKLEDEYELPGGTRTPKTPAAAGQTLVKGDGSGTVSDEAATVYRSGTATMMFMMQWSRPDIYNAVRGLARHMSAPREAHVKAMGTAMKYVVATRNRGLVLAPDTVWDGGKSFNETFAFRIHGRSDSDYAANTDDRRSVSGGRVFLNGAPVTFKSATQKCVTLSVTEAEGGAGVLIAQDMLYVYRIVTSMGLRVKLPMILEMDNKGAVDLANNWSVGGRTRHVDVKNHFLRELKDLGLLLTKFVPGDLNDADIFTKNTTGPIFERHLPNFVGIDEYMNVGVHWDL